MNGLLFLLGRLRIQERLGVPAATCAARKRLPLRDPISMTPDIFSISIYSMHKISSVKPFLYIKVYKNAIEFEIARIYNRIRSVWEV